MSELNSYILAAYCIILAFIHSKECLIVLICFGLSCVYTDISAAYHQHEPYLNHLIIIMFMLPSMLLSTKHVAITVMIYILLHWFASIDFILFTFIDTVVSANFTLVSCVLNLMIMISLIYANYNRDSYSDNTLGNSWVFSFLRSKIKDYAEG